MRSKIILSIAAVAMGFSTPSAASVEIQDYTFSVSLGGPIPSHNGSFSLSFDNVANTYSLLAIDYSIGTTVFDTSNAAAQTWLNGFLVYGTQNGIGVDIGTDDFFIGGPNVLQFAYTTIDTSSDFGTQDNVSITRVASVPEPDTWAIMLLGFGSIGFAMRRRKQAELNILRAA